MVFFIILFPFHSIWVHYRCDASSRSRKKSQNKRRGEKMGRWDWKEKRVTFR